MEKQELSVDKIKKIIIDDLNRDGVFVKIIKKMIETDYDLRKVIKNIK